MITVRGKLYLTDIGAHESIYEGVTADVEIRFTKGQVILDSIVIHHTEEEYIKSVGSTKKHWLLDIRNEFDNSGDYVLDSIVENLPDEEYARAEAYITAYYQDHPMPDGVKVDSK